MSSWRAAPDFISRAFREDLSSETRQRREQNVSRAYDSAAPGSDIVRTQKQYPAWRFASALVSLLYFNKLGLLTTEIVQAINPVATIDTPHGPSLCKVGHGWLLWCAQSFYDEEPGTVLV